MIVLGVVDTRNASAAIAVDSRIMAAVQEERFTHMTVAFPSTPAARRDLPAALHPADFTMRPQEIRPDDVAPVREAVEAIPPVSELSSGALEVGAEAAPA